MKVKVKLSIGLVGCTREGTIKIDDEDLEGLSEQERNGLIQEEVDDWAANRTDVEWEIVE